MQNNNTAIILDDLQIAQVEALANYLPIEQVAGYFNISVSDFLDLQKKDERVLRAYKKGKIRGVCKVATLLWQQMEAGNVTAIIFFLKTRGGWSEKPLVEKRDDQPKFKNIKLICNGFEVEKAKNRMQELQFKKIDKATIPVGYPEEITSGNSRIEKVYSNIHKAKFLKPLNFQRKGAKLFTPTHFGVMTTKEATEVMARL